MGDQRGGHYARVACSVGPRSAPSGANQYAALPQPEPYVRVLSAVRRDEVAARQRARQRGRSGKALLAGRLTWADMVSRNHGEADLGTYLA